MPKPLPTFQLPRLFDSALLLKQASPGETIVVVLYKDAYNQSPFQFGDTHGRVAIFTFEAKYGCHALRVPESIWNATNGAMAEAFMQSGSRDRFVVRTETPAAAKLAESTPQAVSPIAALIDAMKADPEYAWAWHCNIAMAAHDAGATPHAACNRGAALFLSLLSDGAVDTTLHPTYEQTHADTVSKSQDGEVVNSPDSYSGIAGANPSPATNSDEMGAADTDGDAPNVVGQGEADSTVAPASETFTLPAEGVAYQVAVDPPATNALPPVEVQPEPLHEAAFDKLESPMRIKALAALLGTNEATLKTALEDPQSRVELGHAGWVKRK